MYYLALAVCLIAFVTDIRDGEIPDWLTLPSIVVGIVWGLAHSNFMPIFGLLAALAVGYTLFFFGEWLFDCLLIGGGDVKLILALGVLLEMKLFLICVAISLVLSSIVCVINGMNKKGYYTEYAPWVVMALLITKSMGV